MSELVICYLFLGGAGAGACATLAVMGLFVPHTALVAVRVRGAQEAARTVVAPPREYRRLFAPTYLCAIGALVLGIVILAADLGNIDRLILLVTQPEPTYVTLGAYALVVCTLLAVLLACVWASLLPRVPYAVFAAASVFMLVIAMVVMTYTGLLLKGLRAVALWDSVWLPVLFVLSALSCGIALVAIACQFTGASRLFERTLRHLFAADAVFIVLEALAAAALVLSVWLAAREGWPSGTAAAAVGSLEALLAGEVSRVFWIAFVGVGLAAPLAVELVSLRSRRASWAVALLTSAFVLAGGLAMRYCIVEAGMRPVLFTAAMGM